jgi:hypothetical protein
MDRFGSALAEYGTGGLAVGAPGENLGTIVDAGHVDGYRAAAGGLPGTGPLDRLQQGAAPIQIGTSEAGDSFGYALASRPGGWLTIGVPGEDLGSVRNAGIVIDAGVPGLHDRRVLLRQGGGGLPGTAEGGDRLGASLTTLPRGLAIGAPGEGVGDGYGAGLVHVIPERPAPNDAHRLDLTADRVIHQDSPGVPDQAEVGDAFGHSIAAGPAALVVGVPQEDVPGALFLQNAGAVMLFATDGAQVVASPAPQIVATEIPYHEDGPQYGYTVAASTD